MKTKKYALYLLALTVVVFCFGCNTATRNLNGNTNGICISGNCENGYGTWRYPDGGQYVGPWKNGLRNGQGTDYFADGSRYVGQFVDGKRNGHGTYTGASGYNYTGQWSNNKENGQGRAVCSNGERQEGTFIDGFMVYGKSEFPNGNRYVGQYRPDGNGIQRHGQGTFTWADGSTYTGTWVADKPEEGILTDPKGRQLYPRVGQEDTLVSSERLGEKGREVKKTSVPSGRRWKKAN